MTASAEASRRYRARHPERIKAQNRAYYEKHKAARRASALARYHRRRDEILAKRRLDPAVKAARQAYKDANKLGTRRATRLRKYGTDGADLLAAQGGACAICGRPLDLAHRHTHIDHCHTTGQVRGVLCHGCNTGLGKFGDDPARLDNAAAYLRQKAQRETA